MISFHPDAYGQQIRILETKAGTVTVYPTAFRRRTPREEELDCRVYMQFLRRHRSGRSDSHNVREMQLHARLDTPLTFHTTHRFYLLLDFIDESESLEQLRESVPSLLIGDVMKMEPSLFAQFKTKGVTNILRNQLSEPDLRSPRDETILPLKTLASLYLCVEFLGEISKFTNEAVCLEHANDSKEQDYLQQYEERVANATRLEMNRMVDELKHLIQYRNCYETFKAHMKCECLMNSPRLSTEGFNTLIQTMAFANYPLKLSEALRSDRIDTITKETAEGTLMHLLNHKDWGNIRLMERFLPFISDHYFVLFVKSVLGSVKNGNLNLIDVLSPVQNRIHRLKREWSEEHLELIGTYFSEDLGGASLPCSIL